MPGRIPLFQLLTDSTDLRFVFAVMAQEDIKLFRKVPGSTHKASSRLRLAAAKYSARRKRF